jgi:16S rRNA (cytosine967-C5)-methyltransferase
MAVWDVCAGGGGKTMQIASQMKNRGVLYASDIRDYKLDELKLRARRAGFHNVRRFVYDGSRLDAIPGSAILGASVHHAEKSPELPREIRNAGGFHRILVDAPCSASGTLRRNPDVRYRIMPGDPEKFAALQLKILAAVEPHLKPGGKLVYATCSVFRTENEAVVEKFLLGRTGLSLTKAACVGSPELDSDTMFFAVLEKAR